MDGPLHQQCRGVCTDGTACQRTQAAEYCWQHLPPRPSNATDAITERSTSYMINDDDSAALCDTMSGSMMHEEHERVTIPANLTSKDRLERYIIELETKLKIARKKLRSYNVTNQHIEKKALRMYYHAHKDNPAIIGVVRNNLNNTGMLTRRANSKGVLKDVIPWQLVFECTTSQFNQLGQAEKDRYMQMARNALVTVS